MTINDEINTQPIDEIQFDSQSQYSQSQNSPPPWGKLVPYVSSKKKSPAKTPDATKADSSCQKKCSTLLEATSKL